MFVKYCCMVIYNNINNGNKLYFQFYIHVIGLSIYKPKYRSKYMGYDIANVDSK